MKFKEKQRRHGESPMPKVVSLSPKFEPQQGPKVVPKSLKFEPQGPKVVPKSLSPKFSEPQVVSLSPKLPVYYEN